MHGVTLAVRRSLPHWAAAKKWVIAARHMSIAAMPEPAPASAPKVYPVKVEKIASDIAGLTLLEVSELSELLKKRLNLPDVPAFPAGGFMPMASAPPAEEEKEQKVKNVFTVKLNKFDEKQKVAVIKVIKSLMEGMNLVQAKKFVESAPVVVKENCDKEEAEKLKKELTAVGADVALE